jgi:type 1 fimbriae regulatory protein FimB/type 1 fimbriae regulatory protein FimE
LREEGQIMTRKAMPTRKPNSEYRTREHLLEREVEALIKAAKGNRNGLRDSTIILMMWRHGLRVSEACGLQWGDVSFEDATLYVRRAKGGEHGTHPIADDEIAALRALQREAGEQWLFTSERGGPFERAGIARMIERAGIAAGLPFQCHPHQLRHACGYALVNRGVDTRTLQAFMGHRSITSTTRYAALAPGRFKNLWS